MADFDWGLVAPPLKTIFADYWRTSRLVLATVVVVIVLSAVSATAAPYLFSRLVDTLTQGNWQGQLFIGFLAYAVLLGLSAALQNVSQYISFMNSENLGFIAGTSFFSQLLKKTAAFFVEHNPAEIQSAETTGQNALHIVVQLSLIVFVPGTVQIALALAVLGAAISPEIMLIVLVYGIIFIALSYRINIRTRPLLDAAIEGVQENARFVGNAIGGMETLRHFGSERWMRDRFTARARDIRDNWRSFAMQRAGYALIFGLALAIQFSISLWYLLPRLETGDLSVGDLVLFNALLLQLNQPFEMIGRTLDDAIRSYSRFLPFARMWAAENEPDSEVQQDFALKTGEIAFENVGYAYDNGRGVKDVSFTASRGPITFLTGETGSGKTTLFRLALKSIAPQEGDIRVDGRNLETISRKDWFHVTGVVPQDILLLNDTIATNIVLGREPDDARLRNAAGKAAILDFIDNLPEGFETKVGERGLKLSGGERQRIAIARALYAEPQILFLDEASSALDAATEKEIMSHIRAIAGQVTVIAITHRKTVMTKSDQVVRLKNGKMRA